MTNSNELKNKPYLVDAVIGNSAFLASLDTNGRMYRMWWPHIDTPQHVDTIRTALQFHEEEDVVWFDEEECGWTYKSAYVDRSNIFSVQARSQEQSVSVDSLHFAVPGLDLIVREYTLMNNGPSPVSFDFLLHSSFHVGDNDLYNTTIFHVAEDSLIHYRKEYYFAVSSSTLCDKFQAGITLDHVQQGIKSLVGKSIDMQPGGAMAWHINNLEPGHTIVLPVYITAGHSKEEALDVLSSAKSRSSAQWVEETNSYWHRYLNEAAPCPIRDSTIKELYDRSLLVFKLMTDDKSGSIVAAPEFDERFTRCGGYAYCWGRDAAFITTALDKAGLIKLSDRFYDWTLTSQSPDGSWDQRHYHDGSLAPSWGLQIDEGASIIWGMYQHYLVTNNMIFARNVWPSVRRGAQFLYNFLDETTGLPSPSMDLWEEREGSHTYSSAAVYGGLTAAASFATLAGEQWLATQWNNAAERIAEAIVKQCWNESGGSFYRGINLTVSAEKFDKAVSAGMKGQIIDLDKGYHKYVLRHDPVIDVSLLGISIPFGAVPADSKYMRQTADAVRDLLWVPSVGGIKRYEDDPYIGGNPWILTTLWLAQYRIATGELDEARRLIQWSIDHRTTTGLLPEQVDRENSEPAWVVPLTWSHAMFVLAVWQLAEAT